MSHTDTSLLEEALDLLVEAEHGFFNFYAGVCPVCLQRGYERLDHSPNCKLWAFLKKAGRR